MKNKEKKKKVLLITLAIIIVTFSVVISLARYILDFSRNHILSAKGFYFNSTTMTSLGSSHNISNWDGVNAYEITIDLNSKKNKYVATDEDITYDISVECSDNATCVSSKQSGTISKSTHEDSYTITVYPKSNISAGDTASVTTIARSKTPYEKELKTTYNIHVVTFSFSYTIEDSVNSKYLTLELQNSFSYYQALEDFGTYHTGDNISIDEYNQLSATDKAKCKSAIVTLTYDPSILRIDMTNNLYLDNKATESTEVLDSHNYVNKLTVPVGANTTKKIIFYKSDINNDYSYDGRDGTSIIGVTVDTVS